MLFCVENIFFYVCLVNVYHCVLKLFYVLHSIYPFSIPTTCCTKGHGGLQEPILAVIGRKQGDTLDKALKLLLNVYVKFCSLTNPSIHLLHPLTVCWTAWTSCQFFALSV